LWFRKGVEAALLAPTAVNQQKFFFQYVSKAPQSVENPFEYTGTTKNRHQVHAKRGISMIGYTKMDLGIAKYHFEIGAGKGDDGEHQSSGGEHQPPFDWV
jgi:hypothetical protein